MNNTNEWLLQSLSITKDWQKQGFYTGNVTFENGIKMQMSLRMDNESAVKMISLLQDEIVKSANNLSETLAKSMPIMIQEK
jgi:hypothetical protein